LFPLGLSDSFACSTKAGSALREASRPDQRLEGLHDLAASFAIVEASRPAGPCAQRVLDGSVDAYQRDLDEHYGLLD